jgi:molybdate transport system substrate-binding protein
MTVDAPPPRISVLISGGFEPAYRALLPEFERAAAIEVTTLSGASQGVGPKTIRFQLEHGAEVDIVILSNEGLRELTDAGWILPGSAVELASVPLAAAVRSGAAKPEIQTVGAFTKCLVGARLVAMPGSTSGLFILNEVLPRLQVTHAVRTKVLPRGADSAAALAAGEADLALGPVSELVGIAGIELVGLLPQEVQLVQSFSAAVLTRSSSSAAARRLIAFLGSPASAGAIERSGMIAASGNA